MRCKGFFLIFLLLLGRGPTNFRPTVTPRKKKAAANSTFSQDYYDENYVDMQCGRG